MLSGLPLPWMQAAPNCVASRVPFHFGNGSGAFQRIAPTGGCAYGIPLNAWMPPAAVPCSLPAGAETSGGASAPAGKEINMVATSERVINARDNENRIMKGLHSALPA